MKDFKIGDVIVPTYIDDEFLAQYTNILCEIKDIKEEYNGFYDAKLKILVVKPLFNGSSITFELFEDIDKWREGVFYAS